MGNSESSSSKLPCAGNTGGSGQPRKNETEEETSAANSVLKVGAAVAGTALLALGAWNLASSLSSESTEDEAKKVDAINRYELPKVQVEGCRGLYVCKFIKIMSYNVWLLDIEVSRRMEAIGQLIQDHSPDVIFFQEVTPTIYEIFQSSHWWALYKYSVPQQRATSCMLLSKLPVVKRFNNKCFENSTTGRQICAAELCERRSNNSLVVASSHFKRPNLPETNSIKRQAQAEEALRLLNCYPNAVLGGDMNWDEVIDGDFPLYGDWIDAWSYMKPAEDGFTYDSRANQSLRGNKRLQKRLDRFVCKLRDFEVTDIKMIGTEAIPDTTYSHRKKENPVYPSDHFGLLLTISSV